MTARHALVATLLVPLALLAGCSEDEPVPQFPDPTTAVPRPSASTSTAAPETPEEFIRRFNDAQIEMQNSGDVEPYLALTQDCRACSDVAERVRGFYDAGGFVKWNGWNIRQMKVQGQNEDTTRIVVRFVSAPTSYRPSKGAAIERFDGGPSTFILTLVQADDSWLVTDMAEQSS